MMQINHGYLARLMVGMTIGASGLDSETRQKHLQYVLSRQREDGGWSGREGISDLYYTSFALRSLAILGVLEGEVADRSGLFLRSRMNSHESIVDLLSLVYSARLIEASCSMDPLADFREPWADRLVELLQSLRCPDGGYAKIPGGRAGSTYQSFLALICLELISAVIPEPDRTAAFLLNQRQDDGGFLEIRVAKRSGTNPTAAAIGGLRVLNRIESSIAVTAAEFLLELQTDEGGFQANTRIPLPDLLSTFTAVVTLSDLDALGQCNLAAVQRYVRSMELSGGGFHGFEFDNGDDVEYTFYGLGTLALTQLFLATDSWTKADGIVQTATEQRQPQIDDMVALPLESPESPAQDAPRN